MGSVSLHQSKLQNHTDEATHTSQVVLVAVPIIRTPEMPKAMAHCINTNSTCMPLVTVARGIVFANSVTATVFSNFTTRKHTQCAALAVSILQCQVVLLIDRFGMILSGERVEVLMDITK